MPNQSDITLDEYHKLCIIAINGDPYALRHVVVKHLAPHDYHLLCTLAIQREGNALQYVKNQSVDEYYKLCVAAVNENGMAIKHVKKECHTDNRYREICMAAIQQSEYGVLHVMPLIKYQTLEICKAAIQINPRALEFVHDQTEEICIFAVEREGSVLKLVRPGQQTRAICLAAIRNNWHALKYVDENLQTDDICIAAMMQDCDALQYVKHQTEGIMNFVRSMKFELNLGYISLIESQTLDICLSAVRNNPVNLEFVKISTPEDYYEICICAIINPSINTYKRLIATDIY
jgi:hypothetical protein